MAQQVWSPTADFVEQLFNEIGPFTGAMEVMVQMLTKRIEITEGAGTEQDLMECKISHNMFTFLESEGGDAWQDRN